MSFIITRDIPLSRQTIDAWKSQGGVVPNRGRSQEFVTDIIDRHNRAQSFSHDHIEFVLNMGSAMTMHYINGVLIVNPSGAVSALWSPGSTRRAFGDLLPPKPETGNTDWWSKNTGRAGNGKLRHSTAYIGGYFQAQHEDVQVHITGQEYRIITVGNRIVQQFLRYGENGDRTYRQLPLNEVPGNIKSLVASATAQLDPILTLVAWDTIQDSYKAYLLEGNTCPGVKEYTARRIVTAIKEHINADT